ncbi:hypothetical protein FRC14_005947 [Serendipita sp. 396]|nr:hypothetical protein FRC14_005947 [Serendipita sp. 396]
MDTFDVTPPIASKFHFGSLAKPIVIKEQPFPDNFGHYFATRKAVTNQPFKIIITMSASLTSRLGTTWTEVLS